MSAPRPHTPGPSRPDLGRAPPAPVDFTGLSNPKIQLILSAVGLGTDQCSAEYTLYGADVLVP